MRLINNAFIFFGAVFVCHDVSAASLPLLTRSFNNNVHVAIRNPDPVTRSGEASMTSIPQPQEQLDTTSTIVARSAEPVRYGSPEDKQPLRTVDKAVLGAFLGLLSSSVITIAAVSKWQDRMRRKNSDQRGEPNTRFTSSNNPRVNPVQKKKIQPPPPGRVATTMNNNQLKTKHAKAAGQGDPKPESPSRPGSVQTGSPRVDMAPKVIVAL